MGKRKKGKRPAGPRITWETSKNKFLDDLGLARAEYGTNWADGDAKRLREERRLYGFDRRETYNLDKTYAEWLYSHLMLYMDVAPRIVDLEFHKVRVKGKNRTLDWVIRKILRLLGKYLVADAVRDRQKKARWLSKATRLWAKIVNLAWW